MCGLPGAAATAAGWLPGADSAIAAVTAAAAAHVNLRMSFPPSREQKGATGVILIAFCVPEAEAVLVRNEQPFVQQRSRPKI
jgi:hypothetical protein